MQRPVCFVLASLLSLSLLGCSGDKCEKAINKMMTIVKESMGDIPADKAAEFDKTMEGKKKENIEGCRAQLAGENKAEVEKALDCLSVSATLEEAKKCPRLDFDKK